MSKEEPKRTRRVHTREFKPETVALVRSGGHRDSGYSGENSRQARAEEPARRARAANDARALAMENAHHAKARVRPPTSGA
jgi:hypothetical protein